jgi:hypothetical protein
MKASGNLVSIAAHTSPNVKFLIGTFITWWAFTQFSLWCRVEALIQSETCETISMSSIIWRRHPYFHRVLLIQEIAAQLSQHLMMQLVDSML